MKVSYNWLQSLIKQKLPQPEKLADLLTMHSFETKMVGKAGGDCLLEAEVSPNRARDCLSHLGIAREICAILGLSLRTEKRILSKNSRLDSRFRGNDTKESGNDIGQGARRGRSGIKESNYKIKDFLKVEVRDKKLCSRYTARALAEIKVADSPQWLKERLEICGLRPINNVVDIANFVMLETGQPLHAFDADKLESKFSLSTNSDPSTRSARSGNNNNLARSGNKFCLAGSGKKMIIVRRAEKGEKFVSLDNEDYVLDESILVIADEKKPVCVAGVKGGKSPEIDSQTKNIILEAANFDYQTVRKASRKLKLRTDASWRFENQLDPNLTEEAIDMAAYLIQEICGGKVLKGMVDVYSKKAKPKKIELELSRVNSLLGVDLSLKRVSDILKRLGFNFQAKKTNYRLPITNRQLLIAVPTYRLDISIAEDLIEEIGRLYGYEKIPGRLPEAVLALAEKNQEMVFQNKFREIMAGAGFSEVYNYSFVGEAETEIYRRKPVLMELNNPVSQEQRYLRPCLVLNLLKNVRENKRYFSEIRLFEIGDVFENGKEEKRLAAIISLEKSGSVRLHPTARTTAGNEFYLLKGALELLLNKIGIFGHYGEVSGAAAPDFCHSKRKAEVKVEGELIGWLAEIDGKILAEQGIKERAAAFELDFAKLTELAKREKFYRPISKYPSLVRDIAALVEQKTKAGEAFDLIKEAAGGLLKKIDLFDVYQGENIPAGKKNFAFHLIFQSDEKTLGDEEADRLQDRIIKTLEQKGWEVRKK